MANVSIWESDTLAKTITFQARLANVPHYWENAVKAVFRRVQFYGIRFQEIGVKPSLKEYWICVERVDLIDSLLLV
jgi:hypothetical protein